MKELTVFEMEEISGGYSWDFSSFSSALTSIASNGVEAVASALFGGAMFGMMGSIIGGCNGGNGGGLLGFGTLGMAIGGAWGLVVGAIASATIGWDATNAMISEFAEGAANGTFKLWG
ncbi:colicin V [Klebsiella pneumoniae]|uniref:Colicin V n=1 Tax=Klebsiella pneumoniae TaxID=573 RepID=A0A377YPB8_KLEPN|nr:colicin V [Klebsiella pneumoniae]STU32985.1 colicin V [Klebsiella pneumoniae]STU45698.1 colicin V [Klebsiella pneumoniae]STV30743.1 colicin V [Klebsiella pneumoniae]